MRAPRTLSGEIDDEPFQPGQNGVRGGGALAIGFGAREAMASPAAAQARPYCRDDAHCQATCERLYPGYDGFGFCASQTCYC